MRLFYTVIGTIVIWYLIGLLIGVVTGWDSQPGLSFVFYPITFILLQGIIISNARGPVSDIILHISALLLLFIPYIAVPYMVSALVKKRFPATDDDSVNK